MPLGNKVKGYFNAFLSAFSFGLIPLFVIPIKKAGISMDMVLFYRFFFAAVMIGAYLLLRRSSFRISLADGGKLFVMGVLYALSAEFLFIGYDLLSAGIASTVLYTYPVLVAIILYFFFKEKISLITKLSIFFALMGVVIMSWEEGGMKFNISGVLIVMFSALSYGLYMIMVSKGGIRRNEVMITFYSVLFSALFYAVKTLALGGTLLYTDPYWLGVISVFSLVTTVLSVLCIVFAIQLIGSTHAAILGAFEPVVAVLISVILFGEKMTWNLLSGVILIVCALFLSVMGVKRATLQE